jgi:hypothetical protein
MRVLNIVTSPRKDRSASRALVRAVDMIKAGKKKAAELAEQF